MTMTIQEGTCMRTLATTASARVSSLRIMLSRDANSGSSRWGDKATRSCALAWPRSSGSPMAASAADIFSSRFGGPNAVTCEPQPCLHCEQKV